MVNWNAEKDQIILKGIFKFLDIKSSGPLLDYLAKEIGENCTPKAVSHRLNNIRSHGKPLANGGASATPTPTKAPPKKPAGRAKAGAAKKKAPESDDEDSPQSLQEEEVETPTTTRFKRKLSTPKRSYAESANSSEDSGVEEEYVPMAKRVEKEPVEDDDDLAFDAFGTAVQEEV
ncbi:hypothetical protein CC86DRAFT_408684 [Ophiobolus disseminans]|uniref:Uncharacterized protein n=1 Tax=Ophiobolus disseminans TaxID=1469910 RepID=A0A6A6ZT96_9PLEO|nr:hypothetical protein CC86DRAFT_408684 [Ophiobolus disseminans]